MLLWGLTLLRLGVTRGFGAGLHRFLARSTGNRVMAFLSGLGVTAILQSSTATVLIVTSFAGQGLIAAHSALAVILGADVGTTLVAQALSLDLRWLAPVLMIVGYILFTVERSGLVKNLGRIFVGLALMMFALGWIRMSAQPLKDSDVLPLLFRSLEYDDIFAMLVAAVLTWLAHSSLALVLLLVSLADSHVIPLDLALVMVLGANAGGTIAPLAATLRDTPQALRIPLGNLAIRLIGVGLAVPFAPMAQEALSALSDDPGRTIVNFHMAFNLALAALFLPLTGIVARLCRRLIADRPDADDPARPKYLDKAALDTPAIALSNAGREALRMAEMLQGMLEDSIVALRDNDERMVSRIRERDDVIDRIYGALKIYMARLTQEFMDEKEGRRYVQILTFATNIEHSGDVIDKNLMPMALKKIRNRQSFSAEGTKEIENIHALVLDSVRLAQTIFVSGDFALARKLIAEKETIRLAEIKASTAHIERLREGVPESIATSSLHLDIIRDLRRINTYMCPVAYGILEEKGMLRESRVIPEFDKVAKEEGKADVQKLEQDFSGHWLER